MENLTLPLEILKSDAGLGWTEVNAGAKIRHKGPMPLLSVDEKGLTLHARQSNEMFFAWDEIAWFDYRDVKANMNHWAYYELYMTLNDHYDFAQNKYQLTLTQLLVSLNDVTEARYTGQALCEFLTTELKKRGNEDLTVNPKRKEEAPHAGAKGCLTCGGIFLGAAILIIILGKVLSLWF